MTRRLMTFVGWTGFFLLAVFAAGYVRRAQTDDGEWVEPQAAQSLNGVRMEQVPLAKLVPAVAASDVEQGRCEPWQPREPAVQRMVQMTFPAAAGEMRTATVIMRPDSTPISYSEMRRLATGEMTSILIYVSEGHGGATNVTEGGTGVTIGKGTADEALRSEALGVPARRMARILERCGYAVKSSGHS